MVIQAIGKRGHAAILLLVSMLLELVACAPTSLPPAPQTRPSVTAAPTLIASRPAPPHPISAVVAPTPITAALPDAALLASRATIPILCYHQVRDWTTADSPRDRVYIVPPARFAEQLDFLDQHGYHTISPDQLYNYLTNGAPLPAQPILISFDDATESQWTNALPLLRQHHFTATFFIMTVVLDKPHYLSRSQLQQLDQAGMSIGAHTWDHHPVTRYTDGDWEQQIVQPTAELANLVGHPIVYFAYPDGLWNAQAIAHLKAAGFVAAFQLDGALDASDPLFTIRRAIVNSQRQIAHFQQALSRLFAPDPAAQPTITPTTLALPNRLSPPGVQPLPSMRIAPLGMQLLGPTLLSHGDRRRPRIALTFDACETPGQVAGYDAALIEVLRRTHTSATLFLGGHWMQSHPTATRLLAADPLFELGNHSWSHANFTRLSLAQIRAEVLQTQDEAEWLTGRRPTLFRFPGGQSTTMARTTVAALGLQLIQWDVVTGDPAPNVSARAIVRTILSHAQNGSIVIMHMNGRGWHTAAALPVVIAQLRTRGYSLVTISGLLG